MAQGVLAACDADVFGEEVEFCPEDEWTLCDENEIESPDFEYAELDEDDIFVF